MKAVASRVVPETVLALLVGLLVLAEPFRVPLLDPDEGRYAEVPREMLASGDWIVPRQNGLVFLDKPPLSYWLVAGSFRLLGESEGAARLPGKLATVATMLALFLFARRRAGERTGALAALFLGGSLLSFGLARTVLTDPILAAAQTGAVLAFASLCEGGGSDPRREKALAAAFALSAAAAVLAKGLVGVVLPGGAVLLWSAATGTWRPLRRLLAPGPVALFLAVAVPWHVAAALREPEFLRYYFGHEHLDRFLRPDHHRTGAPWFYLAVLGAGFLPWTALLPRLRLAWPGFRRTELRSRPAETFLWIWLLLVFAFFSASSSKLVTYVLPAFPALALLLAFATARGEDADALSRGERRALLGLFGALSVAAAVFGATDLVAFPGLSGPALGLAAALLLGFLLVGAVPLVAPGQGLRAAAAAWVLFLAAAHVALPPFVRGYGSWPLVEALEKERRPGDVVVQRGDYVHSLVFYSRQRTPLSRIRPKDELDLGRRLDRSGVFQSDESFAALWNGPRRVLALLHRDVLREWTGPGSLRTTYAVLAADRDGRHLLVSNDPGRTLARNGPSSAPEGSAIR